MKVRCVAQPKMRYKEKTGDIMPTTKLIVGGIYTVVDTLVMDTFYGSVKAYELLEFPDCNGKKHFGVHLFSTDLLEHDIAHTKEELHA